MSEVLWRPDDARARDSVLAGFLAWLAPRTGRRMTTFREAHAYSLENPGRFWAQLWSFAGLEGDMGEPPYLEQNERLQDARFFPSARLNYAENLLRVRGGGTALVFRAEDRIGRRMTIDELRAEVARAAACLREAGVGVGDRVAAMLPNMPEAVVGLLAASSIGAVWSSCSPDFGVDGVVDRFGQIAPKVLLVADGYFYAGKTIDVSDKVAAIVARLGSVERVLVVGMIGQADALSQGLNMGLAHQGRRAQTWQEAVSARPAAPLGFERLPFSHPLYILFSSGTTGVPKCIVHGAGGMLLKHVCEHRLHSDIRPGDRVFYFTTLGWMMWNWLVSGLASGATLLLYDGSPFHPSARVLWDYAEAERCTHFGTSAKYIDALKKAGYAPRAHHDLASLRVMLSTGSPLVAESFDYVYADIKSDMQLASVSGGTDICGCFVLGNPLEPVVRGEIQGPALGLDVDVVDDAGQGIAGEKGELVCRNAFPSIPVAFLGDADGSRLKAAYFERFPGLWHHGDFAERTASGGIVIHGRSDATLNPGGVRIGTAEIYRQVEQLPEIKEAVVIGQDVAGDVRVVLFVVPGAGVILDDALRERIRARIRAGASPRHVPARIVAVADIPRTKSGKITELAVRDVVMGREVKNKSALANPDALELYRDLAELKE